MPVPEKSQYELQREANIRRNNSVLKQLDLHIARRELLSSLKDPKGENNAKQSNRTKRKRNPPVPHTGPLRRSSRRKSTSVKEKTDTTIAAVSNEEFGLGTMSAKDYWEREIKAGRVQPKSRIEVEGHYRGWVNEEVCKKLGIADSAAEAWAAGGGGKFTWGKGVKGKLSAKESAKGMLFKNPNQYFYRHCAPGEAHWMDSDHSWSNSEKELFLKVLTKYGGGDKWGLFSSHIPHRVGYQCSQFYRKVLIKEGDVIDPNFAIAESSGRPVYIGRKGGAKGKR